MIGRCWRLIRRGTARSTAPGDRTPPGVESPDADSIPAQALTPPIVANVGSVRAAHYGGRNMQGYDSTSYGEAFSDVYDDWYADITDVARTVETLVELATATPTLPIVELGIGTGRLAVPLASAVHPLAVWGIDSSPSMLGRIAAKQPTDNLQTVLGDMVEGLGDVCPGQAFGVVFVAFNTFFNLATRASQQRCFDVVASRLAPGGSFVIEAIVPDDVGRRSDLIEIKSITVDRVVLSVSRDDGEQTVEGHFVELTESGGVRLRPWSIRYASPAELDAMANASGLVLRSRWETFERDDYTDDSPRHVSVYGPVG